MALAKQESIDQMHQLTRLSSSEIFQQQLATQNGRASRTTQERGNQLERHKSFTLGAAVTPWTPNGPNTNHIHNLVANAGLSESGSRYKAVEQWLSSRPSWRRSTGPHEDDTEGAPQQWDGSTRRTSSQHEQQLPNGPVWRHAALEVSSYADAAAVVGLRQQATAEPKQRRATGAISVRPSDGGDKRFSEGGRSALQQQSAVSLGLEAISPRRDRLPHGLMKKQPSPPRREAVTPRASAKAQASSACLPTSQRRTPRNISPGGAAAAAGIAAAAARGRERQQRASSPGRPAATPRPSTKTPSPPPVRRTAVRPSLPGAAPPPPSSLPGWNTQRSPSRARINAEALAAVAVAAAAARRRSTTSAPPAPPAPAAATADRLSATSPRRPSSLRRPSMRESVARSGTQTLRSSSAPAAGARSRPTPEPSQGSGRRRPPGRSESLEQLLRSPRAAFGRTIKGAGPLVWPQLEQILEEKVEARLTQMRRAPEVTSRRHTLRAISPTSDSTSRSSSPTGEFQMPPISIDDDASPADSQQLQHRRRSSPRRRRHHRARRGGGPVLLSGAAAMLLQGCCIAVCGAIGGSIAHHMTAGKAAPAVTLCRRYAGDRHPATAGFGYEGMAGSQDTGRDLGMDTPILLT